MCHPLSLSCYFNDLLQHLKAQQNLRCLQPSALCQGLVSGHAVLRKRAAKYSLIKCEHTAIKVTMRILAVLKVSCNQIQCAVLYRAAHTDDPSYCRIKQMQMYGNEILSSSKLRCIQRQKQSWIKLKKSLLLCESNTQQHLITFLQQLIYTVYKMYQILFLEISALSSSTSSMNFVISLDMTTSHCFLFQNIRTIRNGSHI